MIHGSSSGCCGRPHAEGNRMTEHILRPHAPGHDRAASEIDPICGMTVDPATAAGRYEYKGRPIISVPCLAWNDSVQIPKQRSAKNR